MKYFKYTIQDHEQLVRSDHKVSWDIKLSFKDRFQYNKIFWSSGRGCIYTCLVFLTDHFSRPFQGLTLGIWDDGQGREVSQMEKKHFGPLFNVQFENYITRKMGRDSFSLMPSGNEQYLESLAEIQAFLPCKFLI